MAKTTAALTNLAFGPYPPASVDNLTTDGSGNLNITGTVSVTGAGSGGTSSVDESAFTAGTSAGTALMGVVNPADTPASGTIAVAALDSARNLKVNIVAGSGGNGAASATGSAVPADADFAGVSIGGTLRGVTGFDLDTSGVTHEYGQGVNLRQRSSGGSVEAGTLTTPLRTDPTGTTAQPVSGTVTANVGTTGGLALDATVGNVQVAPGTTAPSKIGIVGGKTSDVTPQYQPLPLTAAGAALKTDGSATTQPVSGTVTANAGTGTFNIQANASVNLAQVGGSSVATAATGIAKVGLTDGTGNAITSTTNALDVNIKSGSSSGTQYADGATQVTPTGTVALGKNASNVLHSLSLDGSGNLNVNVAAGSASNAAAGATGSAVPASADYAGLNVGGTLRGQTGVNPSGTVYAAQSDLASVAGATVATAASGIAKVGLTDGTGNAITSTTGALDINIKSGTAAITTPKSSSSSAPAQGTISTVAAQAVAANSSRKKLLIQNTGQTVLKISLGATSPTQTAYHLALPACGAADDGSSGPYVDDMWTGAVQIISNAAGGTYVLTEIS